MTPRHPPLSKQASQPASGPPHAARLRGFLVVHLLAVLLIYATAVWVGGGLVSAPFPADRPTGTAGQAKQSLSPRMPAAATQALPREALVLPNAAPDLTPPWASDGARRAE